MIPDISKQPIIIYANNPIVSFNKELSGHRTRRAMEMLLILHAY
jgi:hypothetical protein